MEKNVRMRWIVIISVLLAAMLSVGTLCGILYCAVGDAFPEGRFSVTEAWKLWFTHAKICKEESRDLNDFHAYVHMDYVPWQSATDVTKMLQEGTYSPSLIYDEYEQTCRISGANAIKDKGDWNYVFFSNIVGAQKLKIDGNEAVEITRIYTTKRGANGWVFKVIFDTDIGRIYGWRGADVSTYYYFEEDEFFRFINENETLRAEWREANKPDEPLYGLDAPILLADISNYATLNVTLLYDDTPAWVLPTAICGGVVVLAGAATATVVVIRRKKRKAAAAADGDATDADANNDVAPIDADIAPPDAPDM